MRLRVLDREDVPTNLSYPYTGALSPGDEFEVDEEKGEALLDTHEYLGEVETDDGDGDEDGGDEDPSELTREELYELAQDEDIEGRSEMSKSELLEALQD